MTSTPTEPTSKPEHQTLNGFPAVDIEDDDHDGLTFEVVEVEKRNGQRIRQRGIYLFPNLITTLALLSGFYSIISSMNGHFGKAIIMIFLAGLFDGLDGRVARMTNSQSAFGEQYDSLSDMLSFGVAPAMLIYCWALAPLGRIGLACAFIYTACAAFRLARFNVQIGVVDKRYFIGLASPLAAVIVASGVWVGLDNSGIIDIRMLAYQILYCGLSVAAGLLMISNVRYFSFKQLDSKRVPFALMLPIVLVILAATYDIPFGVFCVALIYAASGLVSLVWSKLGSKLGSKPSAA